MSAKQVTNYDLDNQSGLSHIAQYNAGYDDDYKSAEQYPHGHVESSDANYEFLSMLQAPGEVCTDLDKPSDWADDNTLPYDAYSHGNYGYPDPGVSTPPTSRSNTTSNGSRRTRSNRIIPRDDSPLSSTQSITGENGGIRKSTPARKGRAKAVKEPTLKLAAPLSALTQDWGPPLKDMEKWANRSVEDRRKEAEQRGWKIARPMNRFMMYRSAYADKTKEWCKKNNHQVVSEITGQSWKKLEPQEIKDYYDRLATIERENHQKAFPDYKFAPAKSNAKATRKRRDLGYFDDGVSDHDPDGEWAPAGRQSKQRKQPPQQMQTSSYVTSHYPYANANGWDFPSQGRTSADPYNQIQPPYHGQQHTYINHSHPYPGQSGQYLQPQIQQPYHQQAQISDLRVGTPSVQSSGPLVSLPGGQHPELLQSRNATPTPAYQQPQVGGNYLDDNGLLHPDHNNYLYESEMNHHHHSQFQEAINLDNYDLASAHGATQSTVSADPFMVDPQLGGPLDDSPYQQYLERE